jgi:hypothetical protein
MKILTGLIAFLSGLIGFLLIAWIIEFVWAVQ